MARGWKERRKLEIIRHLNYVMVGIMLFLMIGLVGTLDLTGELTTGQYTLFAICILYICGFGFLNWRKFFEEE